MKVIFIFIIRFYQTLLSPIIKNILGIRSSCRFRITCSEYAKTSIINDGIIKGSYKSAIRILKCQPFFS